MASWFRGIRSGPPLFAASATVPTISELMSELINAIGIQISFTIPWLPLLLLVFSQSITKKLALFYFRRLNPTNLWLVIA